MLLDPIAARPPVPERAPPPSWASGYDATRDVQVDPHQHVSYRELEIDAASEVRRSWVITAATACFAVLVGIIVGMLVLKLLARDEAPSLALEHAQQLEQLVGEGEALVVNGRCDEARRRAEAVLLLSPDSERAQRLLERVAVCLRR